MASNLASSVEDPTRWEAHTNIIPGNTDPTRSVSGRNAKD